MKIGIVSDIHGNHYALKEVLKEARKQDVEHILVLGDMVGYYYNPQEVLDLLNEWPTNIIKGNHEQILEDLKTSKLNPDHIKNKYGSGHEVALQTLDGKTLKFLFDLPVKRDIEIEGVSFQLNHGTPWDKDEYLYPDSSKHKLEKCDSPSHDFILIGHSHYSFSYGGKNSSLINCGSVGQSRQKGGLAFWAVVNTDNKAFEIKATPYNTSQLKNDVKKYDPTNEYIYNILKR